MAIVLFKAWDKFYYISHIFVCVKKTPYNRWKMMLTLETDAEISVINQL